MSGVRRRWSARIASEIGIYLIAALVGFVLVESGYRAYLLLRKDPRIQLQSTKQLPIFGVYNRSPWQFDAAEGFRYVHREIFNTHIENGQILGCANHPKINRYGSPGLAEGSYEDAKLKLAV